MRYLILSDIHGNWEALSAVLQAGEGQYDSVLCCGDVVGYGADPNRVVEWVREHAAVTIRGNHDRACASLTGIDWFNPLAQTATRWTHETLHAANREWLQDLPQGPAQIEDFQLVHGSPVDEDEYLVSVADASEAFAYVAAPLTFFGHTHMQGGFEYRRRDTSGWSGSRLSLPILIDEDAAYLVNPGSVGQPRDGDARAAFAVYDRGTRSLELCRVAYDVDAAAAKILDAGLPEPLAARLKVGR